MDNSQEQLVERFGADAGKISHFNCVYKNINGKDFNWKDIKPGPLAQRKINGELVIKAARRICTA